MMKMLTSILLVVAIFGLTYVDSLRLCVTSSAELSKCQTFTNITCVLGNSGIDCVLKIKNNETDITSLDGGNINLAGKCHDMKPIIAECTPDKAVGIGYYAVAVAKASSNITLQTLNGSKSCHTGVNKTAGWYIPMSILFSDKNNQLQQASEFFQESCAPGAVVGSNMCNLCTPNCNRNDENLYYGYDGAARCLNETDADVAFVKHLTFLSYANKDQFKLLCKDSSNATIEDYENCHLAKVPAHAIVAKKSTSDAQINEIFNTLHQTPTSTLFSQSFGKNKIFSSSTTSLRTSYKSYKNYLGQDYINALPEKVC